MKKHILTNPVSKQLAKVLCLLSLLTVLAACTFRQPEATLIPSTQVPSIQADTTGCLANQQQISLRACLTAVYHARFVNAYTLGELR